MLIWRKKCADLRFADFSFSTDEKVLMCLFYWWESTNGKLFMSTPTEATTLRTYIRIIDKNFRQKKKLLMEAKSLYDEANKINIVWKRRMLIKSDISWNLCESHICHKCVVFCGKYVCVNSCSESTNHNINSTFSTNI